MRRVIPLYERSVVAIVMFFYLQKRNPESSVGTVNRLNRLND
jgi:hypothetical protein